MNLRFRREERAERREGNLPRPPTLARTRRGSWSQFTPKSLWGSVLSMKLLLPGRDGFHLVQLDFERVHTSVDAVEGVPTQRVPTYRKPFMVPMRAQMRKEVLPKAHR
jgi:hypothetical protein